LGSLKKEVEMADKVFDVAVIGGGTKSLITALYLQTYGGMKVGIFENRHEIGGCWDYQENMAPGFVHDAHATNVWDWYFLPVLYDFPGIEDYGMKFGYFPGATGITFVESDDVLLLYHRQYDLTGERSAKEIARFSERDAETFLKMEKAYIEPGGYKEAKIASIFSLPKPGQADPAAAWFFDYIKRPDSLFDEQMLYMSAYQSGRELFDSVELRCLVLNGFPLRAGTADDAMSSPQWFGLPSFRELGFVVGGTHNIAHAVIRTIVENGGQFFTLSQVDKILIENEEAKGIRLVDGTEIGAKIVVSAVDPYQLAFRFIGEEHLSSKITRRVANLEREWNNIAGCIYAVHELPNYRAAAFNPDFVAGRFHAVEIANKKDDREVANELLSCRHGVEPEDISVYVAANHSAVDQSRVPAGKHVLAAGTMGLPLRARTERAWLDYRKVLAEKVRRRIHAVAPNFTQDNIIGIDIRTPYELSRSKLNLPTGNQIVIDFTMAQSGRMQPIPEWADTRIRPVKNVYAASAAWGGAPGANSSQGYRCYKAIAEDHGLRKPWEEKGRPW